MRATRCGWTLCRFAVCHRAASIVHGGKTIVTGGCGFIGSHLCRHLVESGAEVIVVDDLSLGSRANLSADVSAHVDVAELDVRDAQQVGRLLRRSGAETLIHLAAIHFIPACESDPLAAIRTNVEGTQAVLDACAGATSIQSVVVASSGAVYGPSPRAHRETDPLGPTDVYGHTKRWSEELAELFQRRTGIAVSIARIFNTFGPGETNPHLIPTMILQLRQGPQLSVGTLSTRRDYVFVADVAAGLARMAAAPRSPGLRTFNLGRGEAVEGARLVEVLAQLLGLRIEVRVDFDRVRRDDRPVLLSAPALAAVELGWRPATGLEEGLGAAIARPVGESFKTP